MSLRLYDAHNHLQDQRLTPGLEALMTTAREAGVRKMVVNGVAESDWPEVLCLARNYPEVIPSFGYHPWHLKERSPQWRERLTHFLGEVPSAIGEIGLDRWIKDFNSAAQEEVFCWQLRLAAERNLPVSIHCLQAWGRMLELLRAGPLPACGFVLHSFGGPKEMLPELTKLGARFSLPGYFAHERKARQREAFRQVPPDRLLIETDAPDQLLPEDRVEFPMQDADSGKPLNHPANLGAVYRFAAELLGRPIAALAEQVEANFLSLFGGVRRA